MKLSACKEYQLSELMEIHKSLVECEITLQGNISKIKAAKTLIGDILKKHSDAKRSTKILIPKDLIDLKECQSIKILNPEWKSIVQKLLNSSDMLLSSNQIVEFGRTKFPLEFSDEKKALRSVSNALHYLDKEGKVCKIKNDGRGYKFGLTKKHFDMGGKPLQSALIKKATVDAVA